MEKDIVTNEKFLEPYIFDGKMRNKTHLALASLPTILKEFFVKKGGKNNETVDEFFKRRYGDRLADCYSAFTTGIYGCESKFLEAQSIIPKFLEYERLHGSVGMGLVKTLLQGKQNTDSITAYKFNPQSLHIHSKLKQKQVFWMKQGFLHFIHSFVAYLKQTCSLHTNSECKKIHRTPLGLTAEIDGKSLDFDAVISSLPLSSLHPIIEFPSSFIPRNSSLSIVQAAYHDALNIKPGFGYLCLHSCKSPILGVSYDHWRNQNSVNIFLKAQESKDYIATALKAFESHTGVYQEPIYTNCVTVKDAFPLFEPGYADYVLKLKDYCSNHFHGKLLLAGNSMVGIGVPDCVKSGFDSAYLLQ